MKYPVIFWDSGGTIFQSGGPLETASGGSPSPQAVRAGRSARSALVLEMFGHPVPPDWSRLIDETATLLSAREEKRYNFEGLARGLYERMGLDQVEETLLLADALAGPRYRDWLCEGVATSIARFHEAGVRQGVLANTALTGRMMRGALAGVGLADYFDLVICSCDLGVAKPDRAIFEAARAALPASAAGLGPVLYVGDNVAKDIDGAVAFGWDAALHLTGDSCPDTRAVLTFRDYADLVRFVS